MEVFVSLLLRRIYEIATFKCLKEILGLGFGCHFIQQQQNHNTLSRSTLL